MPDLCTTIGLEIHVQLKTKSKMFCSCDNQSYAEATNGKQAERKKPNTVICPVCLGMPGALPVTNEQAVLWTIKTGLALNCEIPKVAKFDRKHYFYPDLPKGYQISQYDEPFCVGGYVEIDGEKINLTRIHLEEDAGKLIHSNGESLVDLNRAGTPLMEIVTEPDITSPKQAGEFLRKLQKIVRDEVSVSDADMEKGHLRCDANISISEIESSDSAKASLDVEPKVLHMSEIVELKNINSFRFVEKALAIEEERLKALYPDWSEARKKVTRGYDSKKNITYAQREKEEAADYRYFPEPDLPPIDTSTIDIAALRSEIGLNEEDKLKEFTDLGVSIDLARVLIANPKKERIFRKISEESGNKEMAAKAIVHNYFGFALDEKDELIAAEYAKLLNALALNKIAKNIFSGMAKEIHNGASFDSLIDEYFKPEEEGVKKVVEKVLNENPNEVLAYKGGKTQLFGFFMGQAMKELKGRANPGEINEILKEKLQD